jgi:hypothetical protein
MKLKVILLVRSVSKTSMPWNDLYFFLKKSLPGIVYPPIVIDGIGARALIRRGECRGGEGRYLSAGLFSSIVIIYKLYCNSKRERFNLILHIHNPILSLVGLFGKLFLPGVIIFGTLHTDWKHLSFSQRVSNLILILVSDRFICVSDSSKDSIPSYLLRRSAILKKIVVIRNGVSIDTNKGCYIANSLQKDKKNPLYTKNTAVVVARLVYVKNPFFILNLIRITPAIDKVIWFGDGDLMSKMKIKIKEMDLDDRVVLMGNCNRREVYEALRNSMIYLSASRWEGLGVANIEALFFGCKLFISSIPAHNEIANIVNIPTYDLQHINKWSKAISSYLELDPKDSEKYSKDIKTISREKFSMKLTVKAHIDQYKAYGSKE